MLKIKIVEYGTDWGVLQEVNDYNVINYQIWRVDDRKYTKSQLINLLTTLQSEAAPYIEEFNKKNNDR